MMTLSQLKERKRELGLTNQDIANSSGVPLSTVQKVFGGTTESPRRNTLEILSAALEEGAYLWTRLEPGSTVEESSFTYSAEASGKVRGEFTIKDLEQIPDDRMVELIDGEIYDMCLPTPIHQEIVAEIYYNIRKCIEESGDKDCEAYLSPIGVRLDRDDKTLVGPDLFVTCDRSKIGDKWYDGAPDFVLEVVSPSSVMRDRIIKLNKYWKAKVREYWIVDPGKQEIEVNRFDEEELGVKYTFDDIVPLGISNGKCKMDFRKIKTRI